MTRDGTPRRRFLKYAGVGSTGLLGGLAGCTGGGGGDGTPTPRVRTVRETVVRERTVVKEAEDDSLPVLSVAAGRTGTSAVTFQVLKNNNLDRKHGVLLDMSWMSIPASEQAVKNKQVETSTASVIASARVNLQGGAMRQVFPMFTNNENLVVSNDVDIAMDDIDQALEDMQDLTIGTLPEFSTAHTAFTVLLTEHGYDIEDYDIRTGPPPVINALLQRGDLDGMMNVEPNGSKLIASGDYKRVWTYDEAWQQAFGNSISQIEFAAYQENIDEKPEAYKAYMNAYYEAAGMVTANLKEMLSANSAIIGLENEAQINELVNFADEIGWFKDEFPEDLRAGDRQLLEQAIELGVIESGVTADELFVDPRTF